MHLVLTFLAFIHLHLAYHLGMLDEPCEELKDSRDVGAEPKDGVSWTYSEDGRTKQVLGPEMSPSRCKLTELTCVGSLASPGAF